MTRRNYKFQLTRRNYKFDDQKKLQVSVDKKKVSLYGIYRAANLRTKRSAASSSLYVCSLYYVPWVLNKRFVMSIAKYKCTMSFAKYVWTMRVLQDMYVPTVLNKKYECTNSFEWKIWMYQQFWIKDIKDLTLYLTYLHGVQIWNILFPPQKENECKQLVAISIWFIYRWFYKKNVTHKF